MANDAAAIALMPFSGATPAWLARPRTRMVIRYPPVAPMVTSSGEFPSKLNARRGRPNNPMVACRAPKSPISS
jgi:hypothetical protein